MRRHGWSGDIPSDDNDATTRIVVAARRAIDDHGTVSVSEVAQAIGVTRQTVYRYFPTLEALIGAAALSAVGDFLDCVAEELGSITDPTDAVVEGIAYTFERIPHDRYLRLVLQPGRPSAFTAVITSEVAIGFGRALLQRFEVDWHSAGFSGATLDDLVEFMLRILQSFIVDPGRPPRQGAALRAWLRAWIAPAVSAHTTTSAQQ